MMHCYRSDVLKQLWKHGVQPTINTQPELVHEFLSDLYRYELRKLRDCLVRREIPKTSYYNRVVEIRHRYPLLSAKPQGWLLPN